MLSTLGYLVSTLGYLVSTSGYRCSTYPPRQVCGAHDLLLFRNPHGCTEFDGAWHDGSKEWDENPTAKEVREYSQSPREYSERLEGVGRGPGGGASSAPPSGGVPVGAMGILREYFE